MPTDAARAERALALGYALPDDRMLVDAVFALDDVLAAILRSTREPMVGQMRLTWWHEALTALDTRPPPAEPVLQALHAHALPAGISGAMLAPITEGWEALLAGSLDEAALSLMADRRGGGLFASLGDVLGVDRRIAIKAGRGWALADVAGNMSDGPAAALAGAMARAEFAAIAGARWPRRGRVLGALARLAIMDLAEDASVSGSPLRVGRLLLLKLTGR